MTFANLDRFLDVLPHLPAAGGGGGSMAIGGGITGATDGSVLFVGAGGLLAQDANLLWDDTDNQLSVGAGLVGKPSLIFGDDTTGLYAPAANNLGWAVSGIAAMRLGGAGPDSDQTLAIGRCLIDSRATDTATFSHRDQTITGSFAVQQVAGGRTALNSATGQAVAFATGGSTRWQIDGTSLNIIPGIDNGVGSDFGNAAGNRIRRIYQGEYTEWSEMTAPAAPAANKARMYCEDNGAGKTRIMVLFPTGAAVQVAIEP